MAELGEFQRRLLAALFALGVVLLLHIAVFYCFYDRPLDTVLGPGAGYWQSGAVRGAPASEDPALAHAAAENLWTNFPGRKCVLVVQDGQVLLEKYAVGSTAEDRMEVDSGAKTIMAVLIGILVRSGKLDLDVPLARYNITPKASWGQNNEYWPEVTARHLLSQTGGDGEYPPGTQYTYDSGDHIQHLDLLISKLVTVPAGPWKTPVDWAEAVLAAPLGISGLFRHDDMDGHISIGGGQLMSCREMAKVGQLLLNRGKWPVIRYSVWWPFEYWWGDGTGEDWVQILDERFVEEMMTPSFPGVISTYGFLTWLHLQPQPGDITCCRPSWGIMCSPSTSLPILGEQVQEEVWLALGYLTRYIIMMPRRQAMVISLGMDIAGSSVCGLNPVGMSWDDAFGSLLHYNAVEGMLREPESLQNFTTETTAAVNSSSLSPTTSLPATTPAASTSVTPSQGTTWRSAVSTSGEPNIFSSSRSAATAALPSTSPLARASLPSPGTKPPWRSLLDFFWQFGSDEGSVYCYCPIDEAFGQCFQLQKPVEEADQKPLVDYFASSYDDIAKSEAGSSLVCPDVGMVQDSTSLLPELEGSHLCANLLWAGSVGLECSLAGSVPNGSRLVPSTTACNCRLKSWTCHYSDYACDPGDLYLRLAPAWLTDMLVLRWSAGKEDERMHREELHALLLTCAAICGIAVAWKCRRMFRKPPPPEEGYVSLPS
eukprot:TRINITY_DN36839_c0_g1_i1.p1 TRINITY_DN36839_c0_g1~~TRINITY_DN36839_c0_g1_i1.p1  ORF type:complete len:737 (+),score=133.65 TRINITY_DN36839_c0_g1_i1:81-2213(+)